MTDTESRHGAETDYVMETAHGQPVESTAQLVRAENLSHVELRSRVLSLRRQGFAYDHIAEAITKGDDGKEPTPCSPSHAQRIVTNYVASLAEQDAESVEVIRQIENERLEKMHRRLELEILKADSTKEVVAATRTQLRVAERRAKLNGLDAPTKLDVSGNVDHHLIADGDHVKRVDESFAKRHGKPVLALPAPANGDGS